MRTLLEGQRRQTFAFQQETQQIIPLVFHDHGQKIINYDKRWRAACQAAGLSGTRYVHDFRRTAVRNMVKAGIPERVAMQMSGYKTRSIFDRYHVADADLQEAAKRLEQALDAQTMTKTMTMATFLPSKKSVSH